MTERAPHGLTRARTLARDLRGLGNVDAPPALRPAVLLRVGLADGFWSLETPIGAAFVAHNPHGIRALAIGDDPVAFAASHLARTGRPAYPVSPPSSLVGAVTRGLETGSRSRLRFDLRARSAFERAVLETVLTIPRGEVRPYGWVAREVGQPGAAGAVALALRRNPVPVLLPCHRVVRGDGTVGSHGLGADVNRLLLAAEGVFADDPDRAGRAAGRFLGSATTGIFCFPTCRNARRITPPHRVPFASVAAASAAGYRPCKVCRPAPAPAALP